MSAILGLDAVVLIVNDLPAQKLRQRLTEAGFHAYRDNFCDLDGNLFHFNLA